MADKILYHKHPLDVRTLPGNKVGVSLAECTHSVIVASFPDTLDNRARCIRFVDRHHDNPQTIKALRG